ncbi:DUF167 domain-containing protein [Uliginosibacterium sp. H1]|uniref:DUF167 domain-containing protein n=1 Tax=Uliginosibacterium sp. H1 TaxID=3114757 RepID=UPI002E18D651|nr:DUF167 domain-containing protein [Uliginosibacterium sp. H1]
MNWLRRGADGGLTISLHVQPGARRSEIVGLHGDALKVRLAAPPVDGRANECLIEFLAAFCGVPRRQVRILSGETSRHKLLRVDDADEATAQRLRDAAGPA